MEPSHRIFEKLFGFALSVYVDIIVVINVKLANLFPSFLCVCCSNLSMFKSRQMLFECPVILAVFVFTPLAECHLNLETETHVCYSFYKALSK